MENTNYFGRACRFMGRIGLFVGLILCVGAGALLAINPFVPEDVISTRKAQSIIENNPASSTGRSFYASLGQNQILSWFVTGAIIAAAIIAIAYLARKYNNTIRNVIASIAKRTKTSIHMLELGFTLVVWSALLLMLILSFPYAATGLIFPFILNELLFLFGWISYGMPEYEV